ncbi:hypothetical protein ACHAW6_014483 [Cyclotella cf. meneghiniana]
MMLDAIADYQKNTDIAACRNNWVKIELCCEWKDSSTAWQKLSDLKESCPLQVAKFALATGMLMNQPFNWLVTWVLKKRDQIMSLVQFQSN